MDCDFLKAVLPTSLLDQWRARPSGELIERLKVLSACGPYPADVDKMAVIRRLRARRAAWEAYFQAAHYCGMFDGECGRILRSRLASREGHDFRSAMSECMSCFFLAGKMRLPLKVQAAGRDAKKLDMSTVLDSLDVGVEVKAPLQKRPESGGWSGGECAKIDQAMEAANKQFSDDKPNILILVPQLRVPMFTERNNLIHAAYGYTQLAADFNPDVGEAGPFRLEFHPGGRFLNNRNKKGGTLKPDGMPAYRRISAIVCIEERFDHRFPTAASLRLRTEEEYEKFWPAFLRAFELHDSRENETWVEHNVLVLHNPWAYHPISTDPWNRFPQFVPVGDSMKWTDDYDAAI